MTTLTAGGHSPRNAPLLGAEVLTPVHVTGETPYSLTLNPLHIASAMATSSTVNPKGADTPVKT